MRKLEDFAVIVTESPLQTKHTFFVLITRPLPILFSDLLPSTAVSSENLLPLILLLAKYSTLTLSFDIVIPFSIVVVAMITGNVFSTLAGRYICHGDGSAQYILTFTVLLVLSLGICAVSSCSQGFIVILGSMCAMLIDIFPPSGGNIFCSRYSLASVSIDALSQVLLLLEMEKSTTVYCATE